MRLLMAILLILSISLLWSDTIFVPEDYTTIQGAIDASEDGDEIIISPGTYPENLDYNGKAITVGSLFITTQDTSYISQTIIDGNQNGSVVSFISNEDTTSILCGLTLRNGSGTIVWENPYGEYMTDGGGIFCQNSSPVFEYLIITDCYCNSCGGGIYAEYSSTYIRNCKILNNHSDDDGGGIYAVFSDDFEMTNCLVSENSASLSYGGIFCYGENYAYIGNSRFSGNSSYFGGGGISIATANSFIENSIITENICHETGGIRQREGNMVIENTIISNNTGGEEGGGISTGTGVAELNNITITNNTAEDGGGLYCDYNSEIILNNVLIENNHATLDGGGIHCDYMVNAQINEITLRNNYAAQLGGGIYFLNGEIAFSEIYRADIYMNQAEYNGMDICFKEDVITGIVYTDTFTVAEPDEYFIYSEIPVELDSNYPYIEQVAADLYVSPCGSNSNDGLSPENPLRMLNYAVAKIISTEAFPHTIFLAEGIYSSSNTSDSFPLNMRSNLTISGENQNTVILDAEENSRLITVYEDENCRLQNLFLTNGYCDEDGGALYATNSQISMENVSIADCHTNSRGGAISCVASELQLNNMLIYDNTSEVTGGGLNIWESDVNLINCTITGNAANPGGAIYCYLGAQIAIINSIIWDNHPHQITSYQYLPCTILIENSLIQGGEAQIQLGSAELIWLDNNLATDPFMQNPPDDYYTLQQDSPCIDAGTAYFEWSSTVYVDLDENEYYGSAPDMGYCEYYPQSKNDSLIPQESNPYSLNNYPNPFNPVTAISFHIPENSYVEINIFNTKGQRIKTLVTDFMQKGNHTITWDGINDNGKITGSGIYFYSLKVNNNPILMNKCLLMK